MLARPPLEARQLTGALLAGALALPLIVAGFEALAVALVGLVLASMFAILFTGVDDQQTGGGASDAVFTTTSVIVIALIAVGVALVMALGVLASWLALRASRISRPLAVTWAALGVSALPSGLVALLLYAGVTALSGGASGTDIVEDDTLLPLIIAACLNVVAAAPIGALSWWCMARALRAPVASDLAPATTI